MIFDINHIELNIGDSVMVPYFGLPGFGQIVNVRDEPHLKTVCVDMQMSIAKFHDPDSAISAKYFESTSKLYWVEECDRRVLKVTPEFVVECALKYDPSPNANPRQSYDLFGTPIAVDDTVYFISTGKRSILSWIYKGTILELTPNYKHLKIHNSDSPGVPVPYTSANLVIKY